MTKSIQVPIGPSGLEIQERYLQSLHELFCEIQNAAEGQATPEATAPKLAEILSIEKELGRLEANAIPHAKIALERDEIKSQILAQDSLFLDLIKRLQSSQEGLEKVLVEARRKQKSMKQASQGAVDYKELLAYSKRVAKHTMAPVNPNSWIIEPPIPQDSHMRMSLLFRQDQLVSKPSQEKDTTESSQEQAMDLDLFMEEATQTIAPPPVVDQEDLLDLDL